ncbi:hypothetical protein BC828DRAFT_123814 [Blastocladiella britannica]|nr:hypothetical protein BC828DRAFT_123814 [Blastocladiella britannica]
MPLRNGLSISLTCFSWAGSKRNHINQKAIPDKSDQRNVAQVLWPRYHRSRHRRGHNCNVEFGLVLDDRHRRRHHRVLVKQSTRRWHGKRGQNTVVVVAEGQGCCGRKLAVQGRRAAGRQWWQPHGGRGAAMGRRHLKKIGWLVGVKEKDPLLVCGSKKVLAVPPFENYERPCPAARSTISFQMTRVYSVQTREPEIAMSYGNPVEYHADDHTIDTL